MNKSRLIKSLPATSRRLLTLSAGDNTLRLLPPIVMQPADLLAGIALIAKVLTTLTTEVTTNE